MPKFAEAVLQLLSEELTLLENTPLERLPGSIIHADLFRDNVLFVGDNISGVIDFYYAYNGSWLLDLAVAYNDWYLGQDQSTINAAHGEALMSAYQAVRPFRADEVDLWHVCLRLASLRFWLSRLNDYHFPALGGHVDIKNPDDFKKITLRHRQL